MMMSSGIAHALGMGEIEVQTALNEPLAAKIKLFAATPDELKSLRVGMAPQDAFNRMGIERLPLLRDLKFELVSAGAGAPYIKVTSAGPVKEPFLDFILTVNWANGQMMREYTLLLDPPLFEKDEQAGRVSAATTQPAKVVRDVPATAVPAAPPRTTPPGSYGPTQRTDTLWAIANDMRPNQSVTVPQMMIALLKANPDAFDGNNINSLKQGSILRAPELEVINQLSGNEAAAESDRQYREWLANKGRAPVAAARQQRVSAPTPVAAESAGQVPPVSAAAPAAVESRLQLLTPDEEARIRAGVGSGTSGEASASLKTQLAIAMETAEATRQENSDLRMRLEELEKQLQSVQKLLTLKDDTLGVLQSEAQRKEQAAAEPAPAAAVTEAAAEAEKTPPQAAVQPAAAEPSLLDEVLANPVYLGGGAALLLLLVALIMRRRKATDDDDFPLMEPVIEPLEVKAEKGAAKPAAVAKAAPVAVAAAVVQAEESEPVSIGADFGGAGLGAIQAEESEIDPIAEADVYLAYRRYEQAEALLKEAISADSDRHELKLKLLEIYHATKDADSFEAQAESLYAALGGQEKTLWPQVVEMGRELLPDHPLFADGAVAPKAAAGNDLSFEASEVADDFNFDDVQPLSDEAALDLSDEELAKSLDFSGLDDATDNTLEDLDLDLSSTDALELGSDTAADDLVLDEFDLGDNDLDAVALDEVKDEAVFDLDADLETLSGNVDDDFLKDDAAVLDELGDAFGEDKPKAERLSLGDQDEHLDASENKFAKSDLDSFSSGASDNWKVEAAQSVFHSKDVKSETDGLLGKAGKKDAAAELPDVLEFSSSQDDSPASEGQAPLASGKEDEFIDPLADLADFGEMDFGDMSDEQNDDIFDSSDDMVGTKLDLAKAYIDMGDQDGARSILGEVVEEGDDHQRHEAEQLMRQIS